VALPNWLGGFHYSLSATHIAPCVPTLSLSFSFLLFSLSPSRTASSFFLLSFLLPPNTITFSLSSLYFSHMFLPLFSFLSFCQQRGKHRERRSEDREKPRPVNPWGLSNPISVLGRCRCLEERRWLNQGRILVNPGSISGGLTAGRLLVCFSVNPVMFFDDFWRISNR
jgi:hypothetical protein